MESKRQVEQRLCEAAIKGDPQLLDGIIKDDELILDKVVVGCINANPLHVAATLGHTEFVERLLDHKPDLAEVLDSRFRSALHLATTKGHLEIVQALVGKRPEMCLARDRDGRNPLHIAAMEGKVEILKELIKANPHAARVKVDSGETILHLCVKHNQLGTLSLLMEEITDRQFVTTKDNDGNTILHTAISGEQFKKISCWKALLRKHPEMCLVRDRDGRNPLHIAAMEGEVEILKELVEANSHAARVKVDSGETILHLCVKHNQLHTLSLLVQKITDPQFVNTKANDGNTILHTAISGKQFQIAEHVLKKTKIEVNATNAYGQTAMDILFLSKHGTDSENLDVNIVDFLQKAKARSAKDLIQGEWISKKRDALMVVASLIATMAFQAGVNPPGGVWQDNVNGHRAGEVVMAYNYPDSYTYFLRANTIGLVASFSIILLLISGLPFRKRSFMLVLVIIMWLTISSMAFTYAFSIVVLTPKKDRPSHSSTIVVAVIVWCSVMAFLLLVHTVQKILNMVRVRWRRRKAIERIFQFGSSRHNNGQQELVQI